MLSRTTCAPCYCCKDPKFVKKCFYYSKHLTKNKIYVVTKDCTMSLAMMITNVSGPIIHVPIDIDNTDTYSKSLIDIIVIVTKKYQYLGLEIIDILVIVIVVGIIRNLRQS